MLARIGVFFSTKCEQIATILQQNSNPNMLCKIIHKQYTWKTVRLNCKLSWCNWKKHNSINLNWPKNSNYQHQISVILNNSVWAKLTHRCDNSRSWNVTPMCLGFLFIWTKHEFGLIQKRGRRKLFVFTAKIFAAIRMTIGWQYPELQNVTDIWRMYL